MPLDSLGQALAEGDIVLIPLAEQLVPATVKHISSGVGSNIVQQGNQVAPAQPIVILSLDVVRLVKPDQRIDNTIKVGSPEKPAAAVTAA